MWQEPIVIILTLFNNPITKQLKVCCITLQKRAKTSWLFYFSGETRMQHNTCTGCFPFFDAIFNTFPLPENRNNNGFILIHKVYSMYSIDCPINLCKWLVFVVRGKHMDEHEAFSCQFNKHWWKKSFPQTTMFRLINLAHCNMWVDVFIWLWVTEAVSR